jgi:PRC-barrel domain
MTLRTSMSLAALSLSLSLAPAMAQTPPPAQRAPAAEAPKAPVPGQIVVQEANTVLAKQDLIGQTVYAPDKAKVGSISDLILSKDGKSVEGFVIGVGGFLGIGEKSVALKMDKLKMASGANGAMELSMDMTKDELTNTPTFKSRKDVEAEKAADQRRMETPQRPVPKSN